MDHRLIVLSAGTQVGQNVLRTLVGRRDGVRLVATSSVAHEPALFDFDAVYLVPETVADPVGLEQRLLEIMEQEQTDLVIPCRDDDVVFLASLRDRRPDLASRLLCGSAATAEVIVDKWHSHQFCREHGLPFAASMIRCSSLERAEFVRAHGLPLVAKPRRGYASLDVYMLYKDEQVETLLAVDGYIVQQYLGDPGRITDFLSAIDAGGIPLNHSFRGIKHSIQALIAPDGSVAHIICTRNYRNQRRSKWVEPDGDPVSASIGGACARAFSTAGWRGPLNIQCEKSAAGEILIHEFNGRFTGATVDRWLLGCDEVGAAIERFTGRGIVSATPPPAASLEAFESLVARGANPENVAALRRDGHWSCVQ
jgi:3-methyl-D-ornithine--L-lysine ligase PylC-like protein